VNPDLEKLIELQDADRELARLEQEIAALPRRVAEIEAQLADARSRADSARASLKAGEMARRKLEGEIQAVQQKISKYKEQMLEVKTNEQYKALTHEVEYAEQQIRAAEDKILESMVDAEAKEKALHTAEADLKAETAEIEKEKAQARARTEEDQKLQAEWGAKRKALREGVSAELLRHYDRVLKLRGTALAEAIDHKCAACQVMLRPQVNNEVRTNDQIVICDSCHRILYFVAEHQTQPETKGKRRSQHEDEAETSAPVDQASGT
jgi:predicted  nucleic acid-binding Zn-ribbon protein